MADGQHAIIAPHRRDQRIAFGHTGSHGFLEEDIQTGVQCGDANFGVPVIGNDYIDCVDSEVSPLRQQRLIANDYRQLREVRTRLRRRLFACAGYRRKLRSRCVNDRAGVILTPKPVPNQPETHRLRPVEIKKFEPAQRA